MHGGLSIIFGKSCLLIFLIALAHRDLFLWGLTYYNTLPVNALL
jgi:hypothetical protein